jgi:hypothetical protein
MATQRAVSETLVMGFGDGVLTDIQRNGVEERRQKELRQKKLRQKENREKPTVTYLAEGTGRVD